MRKIAIPIISLSFLLFQIVIPCLAENCSPGLIRAMKEEGLTTTQIELICEKAKLYDGIKSAESDRPNVEILRPYLIRGLEFNESSVSGSLPVNEVFEVISCNKTNGLSPSDFTYILEFEGKVKVKQSVYHSFSFRGLYKTPRFRMGKWVELRPGENLPFKGKALYVKTEKGWRIEELDAHIKREQKNLVGFIFKKE